MLLFHLNDTPEAAADWNTAQEPVAYRGHDIRPVWHGRTGYRTHAGVHVYRGWSFTHAPGAAWTHTIDEAVAMVDVYEKTKDIPWKWTGFGTVSPFWKEWYRRHPRGLTTRSFLAELEEAIKHLDETGALLDANKSRQATRILLAIAATRNSLLRETA